MRFILIQALLMVCILSANAQTPVNDLCSNAELLVCAFPTTGATIGATDTDTPTGCNVFADDLGVWYTFVGTGGNMTLSTCGSITGGTESLAYMAVFSGLNCGQLTCHGDVGSFPGGVFCSFSSSASMAFPTAAGVNYYLFIAANAGNPSTIEFNLVLTCDPVTGINELSNRSELVAVVGNGLNFLSTLTTNYQLIDFSGRIQLSGNSKGTRVDLSQLKNGLYAISVWTEEKSQTLKAVIVNH